MAVIVRIVLHKDDRAREAVQVWIILRSVISRRPGLNHDQVHVGDPSSGEDGPELLILFYHPLDVEDLLKGNSRLNPLDVLPGDHLALTERDESFKSTKLRGSNRTISASRSMTSPVRGN